MMRRTCAKIFCWTNFTLEGRGRIRTATESVAPDDDGRERLSSAMSGDSRGWHAMKRLRPAVTGHDPLEAAGAGFPAPALKRTKPQARVALELERFVLASFT